MRQVPSGPLEQKLAKAAYFLPVAGAGTMPGSGDIGFPPWEWDAQLDGPYTGPIPVFAVVYNPGAAKARAFYLPNMKAIGVEFGYVLDYPVWKILGTFLHEYGHAVHFGLMGLMYGCPPNTSELSDQELGGLADECAALHCHLNAKVQVPGDGSDKKVPPCLEAQAESFAAAALCALACADTGAGPPYMDREAMLQEADRRSARAGAYMDGCAALTADQPDGQGQPAPAPNDPGGEPPTCAPLTMFDVSTGQPVSSSDFEPPGPCCCDLENEQVIDCPSDCDGDEQDDKEQIEAADKLDEEDPLGGHDIDEDNNGIIDECEEVEGEGGGNEGN